MNNRGFYFTFEAAITLLLAISLIATLQFPQPESIDSLLIKQKQHDLLTVWILSRNFNAAEMEGDFRFVFPQSGGFIEIGGEKVLIGKQSREISVETATYVGEDLELRTIAVGIYR